MLPYYHAADVFAFAYTVTIVNSGDVTAQLVARHWVIVDAAGHQYALTLNAEALAVSSLKLPDVEEAESPRVVFEERVAMLLVRYTQPPSHT